MDIHTAIAPTNLLLWILLGFLCTWMVTFACLAIKRHPATATEEKQESSIRVIPVTPAIQVRTPRLGEVKTTEVKLASVHTSTEKVSLEQPIMS